MTTINKAIILGRLGRDPEIRYTSGGMAVANISIATNSRSKDQTGQWVDVTEWHRVVLFNKTAEIAEKYLKKGGAVYVEGRIQTKNWEDKESGQKRYSTEIIADQMKMMGGGDNQITQAGSNSDSTPIDLDHSKDSQKKIKTSSETKAKGFEDLDDDIPF